MATPGRKASDCLITRAILRYENGVFSWWKHTFQGRIMDLSFSKTLSYENSNSCNITLSATKAFHISLFPFCLWRPVMTSLDRTATVCEQHNERKDETFSITKWPKTNCSIVRKDDVLLQNGKCSVVHHASRSFVPLSEVEDVDMQGRINKLNVHSFSSL